LLCLLGGILLGSWLEKRYGGLEEAASYAGCHKVQPLQNLVEGRLPLLSGITRLQLDLGQQAFQQLQAKRDQALQVGALIKGEDDFVPCSLSHQERQLRAKLRLKGDLLDHLRGDKWSFRVELKGDNSLFGMKRFSLHRPETRNHLWEGLILEMLRQEGLISLRYRLVQLTVNGKNLGIYALEEHFEKRLLAHNQRREGPILKFDMTAWQQERLGYDGRALPGAGQYHAVPIDLFEGNRLVEDSLFRSQYQQGHALLEGFRQGKLQASEAFDVPLFARFIAICDLFGAHHALNTHQFRFYYNPLTARLEPIPYDHNAGHKLDRLAGTYSESDYYRWEGGFQTLFLTGLFRDSSFFAAYARELKRVSQPAFLSSFWAEVDSSLQQNLEWLATEYPCFQLDRSIVEGNGAYIQKMLRPQHGLLAFASGADSLEIANRQGLPLRVIGVMNPDSLFFPFPHSVYLSPKHPKFPPGFVKLALPAAARSSDSLGLVYQLPGLPQQWEIPLQLPRLELSALKLPPLEDFPFLHISHADRRILIEPGQHRLNRPLLTPPGYLLVVNAGTQLKLETGSYLLAQGPVSMLGNAEVPVRILGPGGLFLRETDSLSRFAHVLFEGLGAARIPGHSLSGAMTCYEAPADFRHCQWLGGQAEDGLNLIRGEYYLENCRFVGNAYDGLDADFCRLHLKEVAFEQQGNDGLDLSGSMAFLREVSIRGAGDKALSVGEESRVEAWNLQLSQARIGLAAKDLSRVWVDRLAWTDCEIALAVFEKKPEFGPAEVEIGSSVPPLTQDQVWLEAGSSLQLKGEPFSSNRRQVADSLYKRRGE
jgi:hypothetical protein